MENQKEKNKATEMTEVYGGGFPKTRGTILGVPIFKDYSI